MNMAREERERRGGDRERETEKEEKQGEQMRSRYLDDGKKGTRKANPTEGP